MWPTDEKYFTTPQKIFYTHWQLLFLSVILPLFTQDCLNTAVSRGENELLFTPSQKGGLKSISSVSVYLLSLELKPLASGPTPLPRLARGSARTRWREKAELAAVFLRHFLIRKSFK